MNSSGSNSIYTGDQLCLELKSVQNCFRSRRYHEGKITDVLHAHVPSHRISQESAMEVLRALASHSAGSPAVFILHSGLNNRPGGPSRYPGFVTDVSRPEKGVIRYTVSADNGWAWFDKVIDRRLFRKSDAP